LKERQTIAGCIESGDGGLRLISDKDKRTYALDSSTLNLQPGQLVTLKGKADKKHSGSRDFRVNKLVKDQGTCSGLAKLQFHED
jgi:hypothetical protein